jgi:HSP20 family molecular chaperone IbpA
MPEHKQSFLERLTGMQTLPEDGYARHEKVTNNDDGPNGKPWSHAIYEDVPVERADDSKPAHVEESEDEDELEEETPGMAIDMYESDNEIVIQSMIAGITPENLHITVTRDVVTLGGRRAAHDIPDERYVTRELYWGEFSRTIELPFPIDTDGAEAVEKYGLLIIRLPKLDVHRTQELKVKSIQ